MIEDAIARREFALTGEALYRSRSLMRGRDREVQGAIQGLPKRCEVADDSVVVMKFRPVKAGNSVEEKTGMTRQQSLLGAGMCQKLYRLRRDEVYLKVLGVLPDHVVEHKLSDETGRIIGGML